MSTQTINEMINFGLGLASGSLAPTSTETNLDFVVENLLFTYRGAFSASETGLSGTINGIEIYNDSTQLAQIDDLDADLATFGTLAQSDNPIRALVYLLREDDVYRGSDAADRFFVFDGDDRAYGRGGDDIIYGGRGEDRIFGGSGSDKMFGDGGADIMFGRSGNDVLFGGAAGDTIKGNGGNDRLVGKTGGDDLFGGSANDRLSGGGGRDQLFGGSGNDKIDGGVAKDILTGGRGADAFIFDDGDSGTGRLKRDVITDFGRGGDELNLRRIDADTGDRGNDAFIFTGQTAAAHAVWYDVKGDDVMVMGDTDGDGRADFRIQLLDINSMSIDDFIF